MEASQGQNVYDRLLDEIREGLLTPGMRLREVELAQRLGHSRTPVREAIRLLEADGLVVHQPRLGAIIRVMEHAEVMELYEMRTVLEGTAARLAARAANDAELQQLAELNEEFAAAPNQMVAARLNRHFHDMLVQAARNRFLIKAIRGHHKTLLILGPSTLLQPERVKCAAEEHRTVLKALCARDGEAAEATMRAHFNAVQRVRLRSLRETQRTCED